MTAAPLDNVSGSAPINPPTETTQPVTVGRPIGRFADLSSAEKTKANHLEYAAKAILAVFFAAGVCAGVALATLLAGALAATPVGWGIAAAALLTLALVAVAARHHHGAHDTSLLLKQGAACFMMGAAMGYAQAGLFSGLSAVYVAPVSAGAFAGLAVTHHYQKERNFINPKLATIKAAEELLNKGPEQKIKKENVDAASKILNSIDFRDKNLQFTDAQITQIADLVSKETLSKFKGKDTYELENSIFQDLQDHFQTGIAGTANFFADIYDLKDARRSNKISPERENYLKLHDKIVEKLIQQERIEKTGMQQWTRGRTRTAEEPAMQRDEYHVK